MIFISVGRGDVPNLTLPLLFLDSELLISLDEAIITSLPFISILLASTLAPSYLTVSPASDLWVPPTSNLEFTFSIPSPVPLPLLWEVVIPPKILVGSVEIVKSALTPLDEDLFE